jgi:hypothetical protein
LTVSPPGLKVSFTFGLVALSTVTVIVMVSPLASVPDVGAIVTTSFFVLPAGAETDQLTGPPEAVSVIVPLPGDVMSSLAGLTVSVPAVVALAEAEADTDADAEVAAAIELGLGLGVRALVVALAVATALTRGGPAATGPRVVGSTTPGLVPLAVTTAPPPGWCELGWCGGSTARVTPAATAAAAAVPTAAVPAVPRCTGPACHHGACSGWSG